MATIYGGTNLRMIYRAAGLFSNENPSTADKRAEGFSATSVVPALFFLQAAQLRKLGAVHLNLCIAN